MRKKNLKWLSLVLIISVLAFAVPAYGIDSESVTLRQNFDKIDAVGGTWYMNTNNDGGALGWNESFVMDAYINMFQVTKDTKYLDKFVTQAQNVLNQRDSVRGVKDYRGLSLPGWSSTTYNINNQRYIWAVHTGLIVYPMAKFAAIVYNTPALNSYKSNADIFLKAAKDAVAIHDDEWVDNGTSGYYIARKGAPIKLDGVVRPHNQQLALTRAELAIYQATGEKAYLDRAVKVGQIFKNGLRVDSSTNAYVWNYAWGNYLNGYPASSNISVNTPSYGGNHAIEDDSHSRVDMAVAYDLYKAGYVFTKDDMVKFGNTVQKKMLHSDGTFADYVDGSSTSINPATMSDYLEFHQYAPSLFAASNKAISLTAKSAYQFDGESLLNLAHYEDVNGDMPYIGYQPPQPPGGLTATATGTGSSVQLQWTASTGNYVQYYRIYRSQTAGQMGSQVANNITGTSWTDSGISEGQTYYYTVTAVDSASAESSGTTWVAITPNIAPAAPGTLTIALAGTNNQVQLTWTASSSSDVSYYRIYRSETQGQQGSVIADNINGTSWNDNGITLGQTYYYTLTAVDGAGNESAASNQAGITIPAPAPTPTPTPTPTPAPAPNSEQLINGNFSDTTGWNGFGGLIKTEVNGNRYISNGYTWNLYEEVPVTANAQYILNAQTRKGTATTRSRIYYYFIDSQGNALPHSYSTNSVFYQPSGTGWEDMPTTSITVPANAVKIHVALTLDSGSGYNDYDNISLQKANLVANGDFSGDNGWVGLAGKIKTEPNGNRYISNGYTWDLYQEIPVTPNANYILNAQTRKGTATTRSRIYYYFIDSQGNTLPHSYSTNSVFYQPSGTGWENMPTTSITVPANAVKIHIALTLDNGSGYNDYDNISLTR